MWREVAIITISLDQIVYYTTSCFFSVIRAPMWREVAIITTSLGQRCSCFFSVISSTNLILRAPKEINYQIYPFVFTICPPIYCLISGGCHYSKFPATNFGNHNLPYPFFSFVGRLYEKEKNTHLYLLLDQSYLLLDQDKLPYPSFLTLLFFCRTTVREGKEYPFVFTICLAWSVLFIAWSGQLAISFFSFAGRL